MQQQQFADEDMMIFQLVFVFVFFICIFYLYFFILFFVFVFGFGFGLGAEVNNSCNSSLQMMITPSLEKPPKIIQSEHSASGGVLYLKSEIDNCFCARCSQIYRLINNPIKAERLNSTQDH